MKKLPILFLLAALFLPLQKLQADPVFSANGFVCGKEGEVVTCKGPLPNGKDSIMGTGHKVVYLTVNTTSLGQPARYTYFSNTGCLLGYTFNAAGNPYAVMASHRSGAKKKFEFNEQKQAEIIEYCGSNISPASSKPAAKKDSKNKS